MKFLLTFFFLFLSTAVFANECISGDCANGYGTYVWENGDKYIGEAKDNILHGQGTYTFGSGPNKGDQYVGEYKNNVREGLGTYTFTSGAKYVGEFKNEVYEGQGTYTFADGTTESGIWKNGELVTPN